jgi:hypothetical protein
VTSPALQTIQPRTARQPTSALHDERDRRAAVLGDKAMLTDLIVFRAAMTRPGDLAKPNGGRK